jgi:hypothetical protein
MRRNTLCSKLTIAAILLAVGYIGSSLGSAQADPANEAIPNNPENQQATTVPTATPAPTPEPKEEDCQYYRGDIVRLGFDIFKLESYDKIFKKTGKAEGLNCLEKMIDDSIKTCQGGYLGITATTFPRKHHDDCLAWEFASHTMPDWSYSGGRYTHKTGEHSNGSICTLLHNADMGWCPSGSPVGFGFISQVGGKTCKPCAAGSFFFAEDPANPDKCKVVRPGPEDKECGTFSLNYWESTPISLEWETGGERPLALSKFPLDPRNTELWHLWRASDSFPLLVYDPEHRGRITSASQLFGPWTFGGQSYASLKGTYVEPKAWSNGYEALAVLDADGSGRIENKELEPLALWFDKNQDGLADAGEVVALSKTGVTELSYGPFVKDSEGNLRVESGFKRIVNGREEVGRSIDWVTSSAPSQFDLLTHFYAISAVDSFEKVRADTSGIAQKSEESIFAREPRYTEEANAQINDVPEDYLGGVWKWAALGESAGGARGFFVLRDHDAEGIDGQSLMETPFRTKRSEKLYSYATMFLLKGEKKREAGDGALHLYFELDGGDGTRSRSEATLSADLMTMNGNTIVTGLPQKGGKALSYRWVAHRR